MVDSETGFNSLPDGGSARPPESSVAASLVPPVATETVSRVELEDRARRAQNLARVQTVILQALKGTLPRDFQPGEGLPQILTERQIALVMDYAYGMSTIDLAEKYGFHRVYVQRIVNHPDAITLSSVILGAKSDKMSDIASRIDSLAPEALTVRVGLMRSTGNDNLKDKIAADLLAAAGYGPRKKIETSGDIQHTHRFALPAQAATGLRDILEESKRIGTVDYSKHLHSAAGEREARQIASSRRGPEQPASDSLPGTSPSEEEAAA